MQHNDPAPSPMARNALAELAHRVRRLCPDHRDPHRFHEEKSEIAHALATLARNPNRKESQ